MEQPQNSKYETLILPVDYDKSFLDFDKEEIQSYYQWFLKVKSDRLTRLCNFLFSNCEDCLRERNLNVVEIFLLNSVSAVTKPKGQFIEEMKKVPIHLKPYAEPDNYVLDKEAISICYDLGIFLGELIIELDSRIKWNLETDTKYADYGQPVLVKKGIKLKLNPFRVVKNIAATIYEGRYNESEIIRVFNTWKRLYKAGE